MKKFLLGVVAVTTMLSVGSFILLTTQKAWSDEEYGKENFWSLSRMKSPGVVPVKNALYREECGSCHMAYSPGLLPTQSWKKIMGSLNNHFGENAELDPSVSQKLSDYLISQAADQSNYRRSQKIMRSFNNDKIVDRITKTPYFVRKHDEIPRQLLVDNPKVSSFSQCSACHQNAEKGSFRENEVRIPGSDYRRD
jgi:hypothetical protein